MLELYSNHDYPFKDREFAAVIPGQSYGMEGRAAVPGRRFNRGGWRSSRPALCGGMYVLNRSHPSRLTVFSTSAAGMFAGKKVAFGRFHLGSAVGAVKGFPLSGLVSFVSSISSSGSGSGSSVAWASSGGRSFSSTRSASQLSHGENPSLNSARQLGQNTFFPFPGHRDHFRKLETIVTGTLCLEFWIHNTFPRGIRVVNCFFPFRFMSPMWYQS